LATYELGYAVAVLLIMVLSGDVHDTFFGSLRCRTVTYMAKIVFFMMSYTFQFIAGCVLGTVRLTLVLNL
jgi:hypothetical protein